MAATKAQLLEKHNANLELNVTAPGLMMHDGKDLSADEFAAPLDERIIAAAAEALDAGQTHYVDVPGIAPLRAAIGEYLRGAKLGEYQQSNVVVTAGMQESRFLTIQMIGAAFNHVALPDVVHPGVHRAVGVRPLRTVSIAAAQNGLPTVDTIRAALASGSRLLYLESPSRLTGAVYSAEETAAIAHLLIENDATAIWDQGLAPWAEDYSALAVHDGLTTRTVAIGEAFPGMGLASWLVGYIAAPESLIPPMQSQKQIMAICTSTPSQYAALEASKLFHESHPQRLARFAQQRQQLVERLKTADIDVIPGGAVTVLALRLSSSKKAAALASLNEAGYTVSDGEQFGAPDVLRLSLTPGDAAESAIARLI